MTSQPRTKNTYVTNAQLGLIDLPGLTFDPEASFTGCLICGQVYQSKLDRKIRQIRDTPQNPLNVYLESYLHNALQLRKNWDLHHSKTHTEKEHDALRASGAFCTPEAAIKLTPLGVFSVDHDLTGEVAHAMAEAPRKPTDDVEGT